MKKVSAIVLAFILCVTMLAACGGGTTPTSAAPAPAATTTAPATTAAPTTAAPATTTAAPATTAAPTTPAATTPAPSQASAAKRVTEYLYTLYGKMAAPTPEDYTMPASLSIDGAAVPITWTIEVVSGDANDVTVKEAENNLVTIDVNEEAAEEVQYDLIATVKADDVVDVVSFAHILPAASNDLSVAETIARLFALEAGQSMPGTHVMRGKITEIVTEYSKDYDNVSVNLLVTDEEHIVQAYRLSGGSELAVGDEITVMGALKRYKDTFEFDAGATYSKELSVEEMKQQLVLDKLFALEPDQSLKGSYVLRGEVTEIVSAYSADYGNITVNLKVLDNDENIVQAYRLAGGQDLAVGDVITVTGALKRYKDTFEFDAGCTYSKEQTLEQAKAGLLLEQLFALEPDQSLKGLYTMTGTITEIVSAYSPDYGNISVNLLITDEDHIVQAYRLAGGEDLKEGDVITVTGSLKRYKDTFEFDAGCTYVKVEE